MCSALARRCCSRRRSETLVNSLERGKSFTFLRVFRVAVDDHVVAEDLTAFDLGAHLREARTGRSRACPLLDMSQRSWVSVGGAARGLGDVELLPEREPPLARGRGRRRRDERCGGRRAADHRSRARPRRRPQGHEGLAKLGRRREASLGRPLRGAQDEIVDAGRRVCCDLARRAQRRRRRSAREDLVEDDAERVDVGRGRGRGARDDLGRDVDRVGGALGRAAPGQRRQRARQAQVGDLHAAGLVDPDAGRVEPAVRHERRRLLERVRDVSHQVARAAERDAAAPSPRLPSMKSRSVWPSRSSVAMK